MKILKRVLIGMIVVSLSIIGQAYAKPNDKGNGNGNIKVENPDKPGKPDKPDNPDKGKPKGRLEAPGQVKKQEAAEKRRNRVEKAKNQADVRRNRPERENRGRSAEHRKVKEAKIHPHDLFNALGKARWSHNPHDERGQGNNGKPDMRDPYGHDKDSGREGSERGRPIREIQITPDMIEEMTNITFNVTDYWLVRYQAELEKYRELVEKYPWVEKYRQIVANLEYWINNHILNSTLDEIVVNRSDGGTIDYTLLFIPPEGFEGTNFDITTTLTNVYDSDRWGHYEAGQVMLEQTQEMVLGEDNTFTYSYDPGWDLGPRLYYDLTVTVTAENGASYTMTYDKQIYMNRCPYGKVTDTETGQPIVGAKVTCYFEDGSIVPLDKASNPTASNPQTTDATGRYGFKLQTNRKYYLTVKADGYEDYKSPVFTEKWHVLREDVALAPVEAEMVALRVE